jgi:hypothetical protein
MWPKHVGGSTTLIIYVHKSVCMLVVVTISNPVKFEKLVQSLNKHK